MREKLQQRCSLFIKNRDRIKSAFGWENFYIYPLCANLFTSKEVEADIDKMKECRALLKEKTGVFSNFRGISKMATVTMLALSEHPKKQMEEMLSIYGKLKEVFWGSEYLTVAATVIADLSEPHQHDQIVRRTRALYDRMKKSHPFLTSSEDSPLAALLALTELSDVYIDAEMERCYSLLKPYFLSGNAVQSISHVLTIGEKTANEKCAKVIEIFEHLKNHGYKYGTGYELPTLGVLALLEQDVKTVAGEIMEVDDFLKKQKGFGAFGTGAKQRLMYAAMLVMDDYISNTQTMQLAARQGIISMVIAQQVAACAAITAASAAAASSSSSS